MSNSDSTPPQNETDFELIEIYVSYNFAEVEFLKSMLTDNDIQCVVRKLEPSQFPINVGKHGQIRIAVPDTDVAQATALIQQAIDEEAVGGDGEFFSEDQS